MKTKISQSEGGETSARALVVSLHDVSPLTRPVFERMLAELKALGVAKCSLLVIPNHHHRGHMLADVSFCRWLEGLAKEGHELIVHGYYHQRAKKPAETWKARIMTRVYTKGEGEFYDLSHNEAAGLLARAQAEFRQLDAPEPSGFIAPAWLLSAAANAAVREAGFRYTTFLTGMLDYAAEDNGFIPARSLVYSPRNRWRRVCSLIYIAGLARWLQRTPLVRLGLHPPDYQYVNLWRQIQRIVTEALVEREAVTYDTYVNQRSRSSLAA